MAVTAMMLDASKPTSEPGMVRSKWERKGLAQRCPGRNLHWSNVIQLASGREPLGLAATEVSELLAC